jgi:hypothetical protein
MEEIQNRSNCLSYFAIVFLLLGIAYGEFMLWGRGPNSFGSKLVTGVLVFLGSGVLGIITATLQSSSEERGKATKLGNLFTLVTVILGLLAMLQFIWIILAGLWNLAQHFFS